PVGVIDDGRVFFRRALPALPATIAPACWAPPVDIVLAHAGCDARLIDCSRTVARGLVVAALGRGNIPPPMADGVRRFLEDGKPVVITSRAPRGRVGQTYGYAGGGRRLAEMGAVFAGSRRPQQARIDLMLALGASLGRAELAELFATGAFRRSQLRACARGASSQRAEHCHP